MEVILLVELVTMGVVVGAVVGAAAVSVQMRPDEPANIRFLLAVEVDHTPQSVCENDDAPKNMKSMLVTPVTSHFHRTPLNDAA